MPAPQKPWESAGGNFRSSPTIGEPGELYSSSMVGHMPSAQPLTRRMSRVVEPARAAPPIPGRLSGVARPSYNRPAVYGNSYGMGAYGPGYGGYSSGTYQGYGGYGGYGAYGTGGYGSYGSSMYGAGGYGMNRYPQHNQGINRPSLENRFIQMAEENSRPAFESIESLVQAFGSVSFMMESTFHAMYSSFRAVLGVAENFGRLRSLFGQVFQTFAVLRLFQWMYRKLLYYLGIRHENPGEAVWKQAAGQLDPKTRRTFWPVAMFLGLVCGGPFLVWRLLRSINATPVNTDNSTEVLAWLDGNKTATLALATVLYDFAAANENELTVKRGQQLWLAPQQFQTPNSDWVLAIRNGKHLGHVPAAYVQVLEHRRVTMRPKQKQGTETAKPAEHVIDSELLPEVPEQREPSLVHPDQDAARPQPEALSRPAATRFDGQFTPVQEPPQTTRPGDAAVPHVAQVPRSDRSTGDPARRQFAPSQPPNHGFRELVRDEPEDGQSTLGREPPRATQTTRPVAATVSHAAQAPPSDRWTGSTGGPTQWHLTLGQEPSWVTEATRSGVTTAAQAPRSDPSAGGSGDPARRQPSAPSLPRRNIPLQELVQREPERLFRIINGDPEDDS